MKRPPSQETSAGMVDLQRRAGLARLTALWAAAIAVPLVSCGGGSDTPAPNLPPSPPAPPPSGGGGSTPPPPPPSSPPPPPPPSSSVARTTVINGTLSSPWSFAFLPDGRIVVTQKGGQLVVLSADGATKSNPFSGVPAVASAGQGGLLDVAVDPDYATGANWIYLSYSEPVSGQSSTAVTRGRLDLTNLQLLEVPPTPLFRQMPRQTGSGHFGSRLAFRADKTLFVTLGERQLGNPAQDLTGTLGKVVRINRNGSIPTDNPNMGAGAAQGIWSYGHRNPQGAAVHPTTGELWITEHGPQGGDELNIARAGQNYGWPIVSYGCEYNTTTPNCQIGGGTHAPTYTEPTSWWPGPGNATPYYSPALSGLMFYTGSGFPDWQGNAFVGSMSGPQGTALWRLTLSGNTVTARERLFAPLGERIRCVRQGPDGWIYFITDSGKLYRVDRP